MIKGQKVVCINDGFNDFVKAVYKQLPVKGDTYTIREVFLGREKIVKGGDSATVGLLLEELVNPPDPFHVGKQELRSRNILRRRRRSAQRLRLAPETPAIG
jgi:hypothetical protein